MKLATLLGVLMFLAVIPYALRIPAWWGSLSLPSQVFALGVLALAAVVLVGYWFFKREIRGQRLND